MVSALLRWELGALFLGHPISKGALLPLELPRLVTGGNPVSDLGILGTLDPTAVSSSPKSHKRL